MPRTRLKKPENATPKPAARPSKHFRYLDTPKEDIANPYVTREMRRCGRASCRCARGEKHGPYTCLRYEVWDRESEAWRQRREFVPRAEVRRVRRWLKRRREKEVFGRTVLRLLRRAAR